MATEEDRWRIDVMKIAIITGASSGMGREFVKQVSAAGEVDEIWAVARRMERLEELKSQVSVPLRPLAYDLAVPENVHEIISLLAKDKAEIHLLVNCAGFAKFGNYEQISERDTMSMIDLNIRALVELTLECIPHMAAGGMMIEIASTSAFQPLPDMNVYAASKAFVLSFSRALNRELGPKDISVTAVCPGWTKTEFMDVAGKNANAGAVKNFMFLSSPEKVVTKALKDAKKRREVSVYGITNIFHMIFAKILPASSIMTFWNFMK